MSQRSFNSRVSNKLFFYAIILVVLAFVCVVGNPTKTDAKSIRHSRIYRIISSAGVYHYQGWGLAGGYQDFFVQPFEDYTGSLWGRRVRFSDSRVLLLFVPRGERSLGEVAYYHANKKELQLYRPFGQTEFHGFNASAVDDVASRRAFFTVALNRNASSAKVYRLTSLGMVKINTVKVSQPEQSGNVLVQFLKLYPHHYGLVTMIEGNRETLKVWRYSSNKNRFMRDKSYDLSRIRVEGRNITLK